MPMPGDYDYIAPIIVGGDYDGYGSEEEPDPYGTGASDVVIDPTTIDPLTGRRRSNRYKDFEKTTGIRYVASGGTPEEIKKRQRTLNLAEQREANDIIDGDNNKNLGLIFLAFGAVALGV
jgi:hypothetical protein